jgi:hypothetical protein
MNRRDILGLAGIGVTGLTLGAASAAAQHPHHHDKLHGECLKACDTAAAVCNETFHHCFHKVKDGHPEHHQIDTLTIDCQEFCKLELSCSPVKAHSSSSRSPTVPKRAS